MRPSTLVLVLCALAIPVVAAPAAAAEGSTVAVTNGTVTGTVTGGDDARAGVWVIAARESANTHRLVAGEGLLDHTYRPPVFALRALAEPPRPPGVYVDRTAKSGGYSLSLPPGNYTLRALDNSTATPTPAPGRTASPPSVSVSPARTEVVDFRLGNVVIEECFCPTLDVEAASAAAGENVTVAVSTDAENITGYDLDLTYDPGVARVQRVVPVDFGSPDRVTIDNGAGRVQVSATGGSPTDAPTFVRLRFRLVASGSAETFLLPGNGTRVFVDGSSTVPFAGFDGRIEVVGRDPLAQQYDENGNGLIDTVEVLAGVDDWVAGDIGTADVLQLIEWWADTTPV